MITIKHIAPLVLATLGLCSWTYGQGKLTLWNDASRLFVFHPTMVLPEDIAYAGQPIPSSPLPSGKTLQALFYAGADSGNLSLRRHVILTENHMQAPGLMSAPGGTVFSDIPGGAMAYFKVIWADTDSSAPSMIDGDIPAGNYFFNSFYFATSDLFTAVAGSSIAYPPLYQTSSPVNSTWKAENLVNVLVPEPSAFVFTCLGLAFWTLRRKASLF